MMVSIGDAAEFRRRRGKWNNFCAVSFLATVSSVEPMTDDAACLRRYAESRDENAFADFVRRNLDLVYSAAYRQTGGDTHLAEDIAQRVFSSAATKAGALSRHPVIAAWLYQATRYSGIDAQRSRKRQQAREQAFGEDPAMTSLNEDVLDWETVSPELDKIVSSLSESDRAAVVLRFFGGKSFAEVGGQLGLSENAARMRVDRALEKLRTRLSRVGVTSSCAALSALLAENSLIAAPASLGPAVVATVLALPPAAVGIGALMGTLHFMSTAKICVSIATVVTLASVTAAVFEMKRAETADRALADALRAKPATQSEPAPAPAEVQAQPVKAPRSETPITPPAAANNNPMAAVMALLSNPIFQKQTELLAKIRLDAQYSALFKGLSLSPPQVEQLKALLVEKQMVGFDSMAVAQQHGINATSDPQGFFRAVADAENTVDAQISALLGANGFKRFQDYLETVPARNTAHLLSQALSYTATPLTESQSDAVVQALTKYGTPPLPPNNPFVVLNGDLGVIKLPPEGVAAVAATLSPAQVKALQDKIQEQAQLLEARQRMGR